MKRRKDVIRVLLALPLAVATIVCATAWALRDLPAAGGLFGVTVPALRSAQSLAILAKALAGDKIAKVAADMNGFRFEDVTAASDTAHLMYSILEGGNLLWLKPTEALSGGETARLLFCRLMLTKPNVLVLDEPTNHLDLESINALNIALQKYEGTVFLVTHDEDLMDEVGTRIWHLEPGKLTDFKGTHEEYVATLAG